jgi:3-hydroxybutyryl-CoA dehydrogenase
MSAQLDNVGFIGGGPMSSGIAEVSARAGLDVVVVESSDSAAEAARTRLERSSGARC